MCKCADFKCADGGKCVNVQISNVQMEEDV
jgi:hypothetical protein